MQINQTNTLKNTILTFNAYFLELLKKWYIYVILVLLFFAFSYYYAHTLNSTYKAELTFMTNTESGGGLSKILQLAGQFGINGGGGGSSPEETGEKIIDLLASQQIIYNTLLKEVTLNNKKDLLYNHYISIFNLPNSVVNNIDVTNFKFSSKTVNDFTYNEHCVAKEIYNSIIKYNLTSDILKSGIIKVNCTSTSEAFSKVFLEEQVKTLSKFYTDKSIEQQKQTYEIILNRVDSLEKSLYSAEYALANWIDEHKGGLQVGSLDAHTMIEQERLKRKAEILNVMYTESIKSLEIARINLVTSTPVVQVIDSPSFPLKEIKPYRLIYYIYAVFFGGLIATIVIVLRKLVNDAMAM